MTSKAELIENLASIEHERWADWQAYVHKCCQRGPIATGAFRVIDIGGALVVPEDKAEHWERLINTPYVQLPEHSKQADRDEVAKYLPLVVEFVAQWLADYGDPDYIRDAWLDEMG